MIAFGEWAAAMCNARENGILAPQTGQRPGPDNGGSSFALTAKLKPRETENPAIPPAHGTAEKSIAAGPVQAQPRPSPRGRAASSRIESDPAVHATDASQTPAPEASVRNPRRGRSRLPGHKSTRKSSWTGNEARCGPSPDQADCGPIARGTRSESSRPALG